MAKKGSLKGQKKGYDFHGRKEENRGKLTVEIEGIDPTQYDVPIIPKNHLKQGKMYNDFCVLNQEFLKYIMSLKLTKNDYQILMFLLAYMDMENKIVIDGDMIQYHLGINSTVVNKHIKKLEKTKVIRKRNLGYKKGAEILINFDIISPHLVFKGKNTYDNVSKHKGLMNGELPYIRQHNTSGGVDLINPDTGKIFFEDTKK